MNLTKIRSGILNFSAFSLMAVVLLSACSPSVSTPVVPFPPPQVSPVLPTGTVTPGAAVDVLPAVATSRGPDLEATDPATVSLASGGLQLVEFFRFTWSTCRALAPIVHGLEAEYYGKINFVFLDADDPATKDFRRALGFAVQPEFYLLDADGNVLYRWFGYVQEIDFRQQFDLSLSQ